MKLPDKFTIRFSGSNAKVPFVAAVRKGTPIYRKGSRGHGTFLVKKGVQRKDIPGEVITFSFGSNERDRQRNEYECVQNSYYEYPQWKPAKDRTKQTILVFERVKPKTQDL